MNKLTGVEWFSKFAEMHVPHFNLELYASEGFVRFCDNTECKNCSIADRVNRTAHVCPAFADGEWIGGVISFQEYEELKKMYPEYFL